MEEEGEMWRSDERRDSYHLGQRERERGRGGRGKKKDKGRKMQLPLLLLRDARYSIQGFCQYSCAIGDEGPHRPHFTHKYTQVNTQSLSPVSFLVLFLYWLNEYFITSSINIHSNGFAHSYYRYFL